MKRLSLFALAAAGLLTGETSGAQEQIIERCKQTSSKDDRIACLEAALLMRDSAPVELEAGEPAAAEQAPESTEPPPVTVELPPSTESAPPAPDKPAAPTGIGAEQVIARTQTQEEMIAALQRAEGLEVEEYDTLPHGRLQVRLKNGQVWRQIKGDTQNIRVNLDKNQTVNIEESSFGGYKLRLNEIRRTIRVQRIR